MMKRKFAGILAALLLLLTLAPAVYAEETEAAEETEETVEQSGTPASKQTSGTCGDGLTWEMKGSTLTISGNGEMEEGTSWAGQERIKTVILTGGVTTVAAEAFAQCENLTAVDFGDSLKEIHQDAFRGCVGLTAISLPATFRLFGPGCFRDCTGLETVHCAGGMPSFKDSCLWTGNTITVYYPVNNPWPAEPVEILYNNFGGRLEILAASADAPQPPVVKAEETAVVETEAATVPTTVPTLPPETVPPTTIAPTVPETTQAPAEPTETVVYTLPTMATQPQEEEPEHTGLSGGIIGIILIVAVLTFFLAGALIARSISRRRYRE